MPRAGPSWSRAAVRAGVASGRTWPCWCRCSCRLASAPYAPQGWSGTRGSLARPAPDVPPTLTCPALQGHVREGEPGPVGRRDGSRRRPSSTACRVTSPPMGRSRRAWRNGWALARGVGPGSGDHALRRTKPSGLAPSRNAAATAAWAPGDPAAGTRRGDGLARPRWLVTGIRLDPDGADGRRAPPPQRFSAFAVGGPAPRPPSGIRFSVPAWPCESQGLAACLQHPPSPISLGQDQHPASRPSARTPGPHPGRDRRHQSMA
jgi:hypothetical protein